MSPTLYHTKRVSSHRVLHLSPLGSHTICIVNLLVKEACLKVITAMFYFWHSKNSSNIMKNIFNSISIYLWEKNSLLIKYKKQQAASGWNWQKTELLLCENYSNSSSTLSSKNYRTYSKKTTTKRAYLYSWDYTNNHNENREEKET